MCFIQEIIFVCAKLLHIYFYCNFFGTTGYLFAAPVLPQRITPSPNNPQDYHPPRHGVILPKAARDTINAHSDGPIRSAGSISHNANFPLLFIKSLPRNKGWPRLVYSSPPLRGFRGI